MSKIYADTIETENSNVDITLGAAGDAVLIPTGATLKTNIIQDAEGNNIITSNGSGTLTLPTGVFGGAMNLLQTINLAAPNEYAEITTGIDSTYDVYRITFAGITPGTDAVNFQVSAATPGHGAGSWGVTKTSALWEAYNAEAGGGGWDYNNSYDAAQDSGAQVLGAAVGSDSDQCLVGDFYLFSPSNTTYVTLYTFNSQHYQKDNYSIWIFGGGYYNTTAAIDKLKFYMSSGVIEEGIIKMYGISKS